MKSVNISTAQESSGFTGRSAVLCTEGQTFQFRQTQTSNTLYVTQAHLNGKSHTSSTPAEISSIALCNAVLELIPSDESASSYLRNNLDIYNGSFPLCGSNPFHKITKDSVIADIPLSEEECDQAWVTEVAFETDDGCYLPSTRILLSLWDALLSAALIEGVDLTNHVYIEDLWSKMDQDLYPRSLFEAIFYRLGQGSEKPSWNTRTY